MTLVYSGNVTVACGQTVTPESAVPIPPSRHALTSLLISTTVPIDITNPAAVGVLSWAIGSFDAANPLNGSPRNVGDNDSGDMMAFPAIPGDSVDLIGGAVFSIHYQPQPPFDCAADGFASAQLHYELRFEPVPDPVGAFNNSSFDARQQRRLLDVHADWVYYYAARKCSCSSTGDPNRADVNCRVCAGLGYFYRDNRRVRGLVTSISSQKMLLESGIALPGDMVFSEDFMPRTTFTDFDMIRLSLTKGQPFEGQLVRRKNSLSDDLTYTATKLLDVYQNDPVAATTKTFIANTDFTFTPRTKTLTWTSSTNQPAPNSFYGVKYNAIFDWIVFTPPNDRFERDTSLGNRVLLRKRHTVLAMRTQG